MTVTYYLKVPQTESSVLYNYFHAEEGMASVRTVPRDLGKGFLCLEVVVSKDFLSYFQTFLEDVKREIPCETCEILESFSTPK